MEYPISFLTAGVLWFGIFLLAVWSIIWKGIAMWHAAKRGEKIWYILLMFINTAGLLEIIYLAFVAKIWTKTVVVTQVAPGAPAPASPVATTPVIPIPTTVPEPKPEQTADNK